MPAVMRIVPEPFCRLGSRSISDGHVPPGWVPPEFELTRSRTIRRVTCPMPPEGEFDPVEWDKVVAEIHASGPKRNPYEKERKLNGSGFPRGTLLGDLSCNPEGVYAKVQAGWEKWLEENHPDETSQSL